MPTTTRGPRTARIPSRSTAGQTTGRFGRQAPPATTRFGRTSPGRSGPGRTSQRPSGRRASADRRGIMSGKFGPIAKPAPKGMGKLTSKLPGVGGSRKKSSGTGSAAKGGIGAGVALLGAAAGMAFKNRDKLTGALKRRGDGHTSETVAPASSSTGTDTVTTTGTVADPGLNGPAPMGGTTADPDAPGLGGRTSPA